MKSYYTAILINTFIFAFLCINTTAKAEDALFGLAMHGQTKYNKDSKHLSYVNPDAPKGGDIKIAAIGTFDTLNPYSIKGQAPENMNLVYDRLMRRVWDEPFTMYPLIAESLEVADDRSWVTFHINPKAQFHDGTPITADDVLFSYETLKNSGRPNMQRIYKLIKTANIKDPHTIHFTFEDGYDRETVMIVAMMPVLSKAWWQNRDFSATVTEIPVLNGPYKIKSSDVGKKITYERVTNYWAADLLANKGQYNFDTLSYDYYRDDTIALESFKKGDLDIRREWDITKWQSAYDGMNVNLVKTETPHNRPERAHGFIFNLRRAPFDDLRVRKALSLAFDYDWVLKNIYHGKFKRINSFYPNSPLDGSGKVSPTTHDLMKSWTGKIPTNVFQERLNPELLPLRARLRRASALLKEAGWIVKNGTLVNGKTGTPFSFEILISTPQDEKIALTFQKTLKRLGVSMNIRMADSATFQKRKLDYDYDMISFFWQNSLSPGTEQLLYWSCRAAKEPARFNYSGICNPALDHFSTQIANAKTYDALTSYAHIIDRILLAEHITIPLFYNGVDYIAHNKNIRMPLEIPIYGIVVESFWMDNLPQ